MWPFSKRSNVVEDMMKALAKARPDLLEVRRYTSEKPVASVDIGLGALVLVRLRDDNAEEFGPLVSKAFDIIYENNLILDSVMFPFFIVVTELPLASSPTPVESAAALLQRELGQNAKIVYGTGRCARGLVGSASIMRYLSLFQSFGDFIRAVEELQFGEVRKLP